MQSESVIVPHFKKLLLPILKMIDQDSGSLRIIRNNVASSFDISVKQQSIAVPTASKNSFHINFDIALRWLTKVGFIEQNSRPKPEHPNKKEGILTITALGIQAVQTGEVGEIPSSLEDRDLANEVAKRYLQSSPGQKASKIDTSRILRRSKTLLAERKIIAGLPDASLEKLMELWRTNISRIGDHAQRDKHLACKAIVSAIELEWRKRLDIHERNPGEFVWPSTVALTGDGGLEIDQSPDLGMLAFLGYHVGRTNGLNVGLRRVILDCQSLRSRGMRSAEDEGECQMQFLIGKLISITFTEPIFCPASILVGQSPRHLPT